VKRIGIILNNIGSPASPEPHDVGNYLGEFLMDKEILTIPFIFRFILVHIGIVPRRRYASSKKYKKIWGKKKSPLIEISESFSEKLQATLGNQYFVQLGMRYAQPSLEKALNEMKSQDVEKIILVPLYPQYARATNFSAEEKTKEIASQIFGTSKNIQVIEPFYKLESFIELSAQKLKADWVTNQWHHILFSFHGLPQSQIKKNEGCLVDKNCCERTNACAMNCYRAQSIATAQLIAKNLGLTKDQFTICFQSRVGPAQWIGPASVDVVKQLGTVGFKKVLVQSPSFVADCLETLEEIAMELSDEFKANGGTDLKLIPCLNDDEAWVSGFAAFLKEQIQNQA
jgi:ferrochelatase